MDLNKQTIEQAAEAKYPIMMHYGGGCPSFDANKEKREAYINGVNWVLSQPTEKEYTEQDMWRSWNKGIAWGNANSEFGGETLLPKFDEWIKSYNKSDEDLPAIAPYQAEQERKAELWADKLFNKEKNLDEWQKMKTSFIMGTEQSVNNQLKFYDLSMLNWYERAEYENLKIVEVSTGKERSQEEILYIIISNQSGDYSLLNDGLKRIAIRIDLERNFGLPLKQKAIAPYGDTGGEEMLKIYEIFVSNIEWHIKTNQPDGESLRRCQQRLDDFKLVVEHVKKIITKK